MTSQTRERYQQYAQLLKADPIARVAREASGHEGRLTMLRMLGLVPLFRVPGEKRFGEKGELQFLTECQVIDPTGAFPHPAHQEVAVDQLIAYGASADATDALEQALYGYCRERVEALLAAG